jgi:hypothetical protein
MIVHLDAWRAKHVLQEMLAKGIVAQRGERHCTRYFVASLPHLHLRTIL